MEERVNILDPWENFNKPKEVVYAPVIRPGWGDVGVGGGGDLDWVDYLID